MNESQKLNEAITAALDQAVAEGVPLMEAIGAAVSAIAVFSSDREGPFRAGSRLIAVGDMLVAPDQLARHARSLN